MLPEVDALIEARIFIACGHADRVDVVRMFALIEDFNALCMPTWASEAAWCAEIACGVK